MESMKIREAICHARFAMAKVRKLENTELMSDQVDRESDTKGLTSPNDIWEDAKHLGHSRQWRAAVHRMYP